MTAQEFRAWLAGFEHAINEAPSSWQWAAIRERIEQMDGLSISYATFTKAFVDPFRKWWKPEFLCELGGLDSRGHHMDKMRALRKAGEIEGIAICFEAEAQ
jgi:hypothetical protein